MGNVIRLPGARRRRVRNPDMLDDNNERTLFEPVDAPISSGRAGRREWFRRASRSLRLETRTEHGTAVRKISWWRRRRM